MVGDINCALGGEVVISMTELINNLIVGGGVVTTYIQTLTNPAGGFTKMLWLNNGMVYSHV